MALADRFGALRERRFRLLWIGQTTSTLGDGFVTVALAFAVIGTLDRSATALGLVLAGPVSDAIGISTTLWVSAAFAVLSTGVVLLVPGVRNLRRLEEPEPQEVLAALPGEPAEALHGR